ncbi:MAG: dihydrofolate synthase, partial [Propionibacteriaceae bacterium]|nr:dihydrofolate synthase [Propionibacteriaceae bacterium]
VSSRAMSAKDLAERAFSFFDVDRVVVRPSLADAIDTAVQLADEAGPSAGVLIGGSAVLAGQARTMLKPTIDDQAT